MKNMTKKVLALMLTLAMMLSIMPTSVFAELENYALGKPVSLYDGDLNPMVGPEGIEVITNGQHGDIYYGGSTWSWHTYVVDLQQEYDDINKEEIQKRIAEDKVGSAKALSFLDSISTSSLTSLSTHSEIKYSYSSSKPEPISQS